MTGKAQGVEDAAGSPDDPYAVRSYKHGQSAHEKREIRIEGPDSLERKHEPGPALPGSNPKGLQDGGEHQQKPARVPGQLQKGQSLQLPDASKNQSPMKKASPSSTQQTSPLGFKLASGRRPTHTYGQFKRTMQKSGGSMSTNDQSNPSPNMGTNQ